jgi:F-type H+-transporting ATPase subunit a
MNLRATLKTRRGRLVFIGIVLAIAALCAAGMMRGKMLPAISLAAEEIPLPFAVPLFGESIPNTLPSTWLTMIILIGLGVAYHRSQGKEGPPSRFRVFVETVVDSMLSFVETVGGEHARTFFPLVATFFLFIAISNWCGILPGFGSVGVWDDSRGEMILIPFFRSANAHLSTTLALAVVSVFATHYFGFKIAGRRYAHRFINFRASSPLPEPMPAKGLEKFTTRFARAIEIVVNGIVGLLEIILEALKVLPFSFRLFGNILAGEVLLFVVSYLFAFVFPIIFMGLELFVGLIQAFIFSILTLVFLSITTAHHS